MWAAQAKGGLDLSRAGARDDFCSRQVEPPGPGIWEACLLIAV